MYPSQNKIFKPRENSTAFRKVAMILEELNVPYHIKQLELSEVKSTEYVKLNPNGRLPTIVDPNTGITLWEVCIYAINIVRIPR
jgi:glutathione S-transferase